MRVNYLKSYCYEKENCCSDVAVCNVDAAGFAAGANPAMRKEYGFNSFDAVRTVSRKRTVSGRGTYVTSSYKITYIKSDKCKVVMDVWDRDDIDLFEIRKNGNALELVTDMKKYPYKSPKVKSPVADVYIYAPFL